MEHEDSSTRPVTKIARSTVTRIIPIVLPNQPVPQAHLPSSSDEPRNYSSSAPRGSTDLNNGVTIFPMGKVYKNNSSSSSTPTPPPSLPDNNPVNLTIKRDDSEYTNDDSDIGQDQAMYIAQAASQLGRKRRRQTHVPENNKDERYWARRLKNNEAAKKSRDMRTKREKVIVEENMRLENMAKELQSENNILSTENKELHLKLGLILDENARLKSLMTAENH
jgi:leukemia factor-related protein